MGVEVGVIMWGGPSQGSTCDAWLNKDFLRLKYSAVSIQHEPQDFPKITAVTAHFRSHAPVKCLIPVTVYERNLNRTSCVFFTKTGVSCGYLRSYTASCIKQYFEVRNGAVKLSDRQVGRSWWFLIPGTAGAIGKGRIDAFILPP